MMRKAARRVEPEVALFPPTYINSVSKLTLRIYNEEPKLFRYEWRKYSSKSEERQAAAACDSSDPEQRKKIANMRFFESEYFSIDPMSSEVWPEGVEQFVITFTPTVPQNITEIAYLYNLDTEERIPFEIKGEGLPATGELNIDEINIGHVYLGKIFNYAIEFKNSGRLPFEWSLIERKLPFLVFRFTPSSGRLNVGESVQIIVTFEAARVGQFNESFEIKIHGVDDRPNPRLTLYGRVMGPVLQLSSKQVDFGNVSVGFLYTKEFELENTTEIPCDFSFTLDHNSSFESREFAITPNEGVIDKFSRKTIKIEFVPITVQDYRVNLALSSIRFEERLATLPMIGRCICPTISIVNDEIDLGSAFIGHKYTRDLVLRNTTNFPGKFEFVEIDDESTLDATVTVGKYRGVVPEARDSNLPVFIKPIQLGHMEFWRYVRIIGSDHPALRFKIKALCVGPNITLGSETVDFGTIGVLQDVVKVLTISNDSLIPATYRAEMESDTGSFRIEHTEGMIPAGETLNMQIIAFLDDTISYRARLTINVTYLAPIVVDICAKGAGTAIVSSIDMNSIEFGYVFTGEPVVRTFFLENKGRRPQEIKWAQCKPKLESKDFRGQLAYTLIPDTRVIEPKESVKYTLTLNCKNPCKFNFAPQCSSTIGKTRVDLFHPVISGVFINPALDFDASLMSFRYVHNIEREEQISGSIRGKDVISPSTELLLPITKQNRVTNNSELPVKAVAVCPEPFVISQTEYDLQPGDSINFSVTFNTDTKKDFTSQYIDDKIVFSFIGIPQIYYLPVQAAMIFPNVSISSGNLNFGSLLKHTEQTKVVKVTNTSEVPLDFEWELLPADQDGEISKIFDVYPIRGSMATGDSIDTHFTFFALSSGTNGEKCRYNGLAVCHIIGGPDYTVKLTGTSADVSYKVLPPMLNFGNRFYCDVLSESIQMVNESDIPIQYKIKVPRGCQFLSMSISPMNGTIPIGQSQQFDVKILPGLPRSYKEQFFIQIGQFDEAEIAIKVDCCIPEIRLSIPRALDDPSVARSKVELVSEEKIWALEKKMTLNRLTEMIRSPTYISEMSRPIDIKAIAEKGSYCGYIAGRFSVDMGNIILGEVHRAKHTLTTLSDCPVSIELLAQCLADSGFSVEPTSLDGLAKDSEVELTFTFNAKKRRIERTGPEKYEIPVVFGQDLGYIITLEANISMPTLEFSKSHFEFEQTLVGQIRVQSFQIQNTSSIPIEFSIGDAEQCAVMRRSMSKQGKPAFTASPKSGMLPPSAFQNIEVMFEPNADRIYSMQFPIKIAHNTETSYITVKGTGVQMKVAFEPAEVVFPPMKPYDDPVTAEVEIINPCNYPIEVYSPQFDFGILCEQLKSKWNAEILASSSYIVTDSVIRSEDTEKSQTIAMSKFSMCIIVNGAPKSGKTTVSNAIASRLDIPVVHLSNVWNSETEDYVGDFKRHISGPIFARGFVVDGLEALPEPAETQQWMAHALKQKSVNDDLNKNPFAIIPSQHLTANEQALAYILDALDGQYVFHIALNAKEETIAKHEEQAVEDARREKEEKEREEIVMLIAMTEEDYNKLSEEEQAEVDLKRYEYRIKMLDEQGIDTSTERNILSRSTSSKVGAQEPAGKAAKRAPRKSLRNRLQVMANDPYQLGMILFTMTLGKMCETMKGGATFQAFDPTIMTEEISAQEGIAQNVNSILIDASLQIVTITDVLEKFLPTPEEIKKQVKKLIPTAKVTIPEIDMSTFMDAQKEFSIYSDEAPGEWPEFSERSTSVASKPNAQGSAAQRRKNAKKVEEFLAPYDIYNYTKRWILDPGAREKLTVQFFAGTIGEYTGNLSFRIKDCRNDIFNLALKGVAVYPDVERAPHIIFGKTTRTLTPTTNFAYVTSLNEFHFGPLLTGRERTGKNAPFMYKHPMKFKNNSLFPTEISASFVEVPAKSPWGLEPTSITVQPGQFGTINLCFHPAQVNTFRNKILIAVKDNPNIMSFDCVGVGAVPGMDVSTTQLEFEKMLVGQKRTLELDLKNPGQIPIIWKIKQPQQYQGLFEFSEIEAQIAPKSTQTIKVTYTSEKQQNVKKPVQFDIHDLTCAKVYQSKTVTLTAESFDVNFDMVYPKGMDCLNFGTFKVFQDKQLVCVLKNKGKYPAFFKFQYLKNIFAKTIAVSPMEGTLSPGDKGLNVTFSYIGKTAQELKSAKTLNLTITDSLSKGEIANVTIFATATAVFTQYELEPCSEIDFGAIAVGANCMKEFKIKNTGIFPFDFNISPKVEVAVTPPNASKQRGGSQRRRQTLMPKQLRPATGKQGGRRGRGSGKELQINQFCLTQSTGTVAPGTSVDVGVEFFNAAPEVCTATALIKISDVSPKDPGYEGCLLPMKAVTHIPALDIRDMEKVFPGQHLCLKYDVEVHETTAFLEDENTFHFAPAVLNQTKRIDVVLMNAVPVPCTVDIVVKNTSGAPPPPPPPRRGKNVDHTPVGPFTVDCATIDIDPNGRKKVGLLFTPPTIGSFSGVFTAIVRGGADPESRMLKFGVEGTGTLPSIVLLDSTMSTLKSNAISFGRTLLKYRKEKTIRIQNNGNITARLVVNASASTDFTIENYDFVHEISLEPQKFFDLTIVFYPTTTKKSTFDVRVEVLDNPAANTNLSFTGEGFIDDVILEGLPDDENELIFRDNIVGKTQQHTLTMKNVCDSDIRFQWQQLPEFSFTPKTGHLHKGKSKNVTVTFASDKQVKLNQIKVLCQWSRIILNDPTDADWDDAMKTMKFVPRELAGAAMEEVLAPTQPPDPRTPRASGRKFPAKGKPAPNRLAAGSRKKSKKISPPSSSLQMETHPLNSDLVKVVEVKPEPEYQVVPGKSKDLILKISAVSDLVTYELATDEVSFEPTMMFEKRLIEVQMTNTSQIRFEYLWMPQKVTSLHYGDDKFQPCPFSVIPRAGCIEGGETATFQVQFAPEDVDDYTARLVCEIPFLAQENPPEIYVTGLSRRPLCHFNVDLSDYLSAGRRHPDYTYDLPADIKVIELFSSGVGVRTIKKFEIINATAHPYEVFWTRDKKHKNSAITCEYERIFVSSGKRATAMFSYEPVSVRTVESVWHLTIPEHGISIDFLIVGRIMPNQ